MKRLTFILSAPAGLLLASAHSEPEKAVRDAHDAFNKAVRAGDRAGIESRLHDGLIYAHSNAKLETKKECADALVKAKSHFEVMPGATVQVFGNTAVWHGKMTAHNMQDGKAVDVRLDMTQVWVKGASGWQMVNRHTARLPQ